MKRILCYGDSNTWGYDPVAKDRFPADKRWTGVLQSELGDGYRVIEEGLNGRTTVWDDPIEGHKNGKEYLIPCLETHRPIDLVTIMLGTNDLKIRFSLSAFDIANGAGVLVDIVQKSKAGYAGNAPKVLLMAPPPTTQLTDFAEAFAGAGEKSQRFAEYYRRVAAGYGCDFLNAGDILTSSDLDGVHFEEAEHAKLGRAVAEAVRKIVG